MLKNIKISIVTVCYNSVATIENTIISVISQTYKNCEYIIIDGGSTDGTIDLIRKYADKIAYYVSEPDNGIYDAMNKARKVASGDFLIFLGADDLLYCNDTIQLVADKITKTTDIYYGQVLFSNGKIYDGKFSTLKLIRKNICHQAIFYPKYIYKQISYNEYYKYFADWEYNFRAKGLAHFAYLDLIISVFSLGGASYTGDKVFISNRGKIVYNNFGILGWCYYVLRILIPKSIRSFLSK